MTFIWVAAPMYAVKARGESSVVLRSLEQLYGLSGLGFANRERTKLESYFLALAVDC